MNCTPATPTLSDAVADTVTADPDTVEPDAGAEMEMVGEVASMLTTSETMFEVVTLFAASYAFEVHECVPLSREVKLQR